ncbi:hypothetical protein [Salinarimonas rosea]|uniref:hypothetical protein n=1 Tax=Salinarimonas rosea TaxID=552063 RepID=UPI00041AA5AA|nr:hypothetical protein [Salinarimonas rosea]
MKTLRTLTVAAIAVALAGPAFAVSSEITVYDAPQQTDRFVQTQRGVTPDVNATGSLAAPAHVGVSGEMPFWAPREAIRRQAEDNG